MELVCKVCKAWYFKRTVWIMCLFLGSWLTHIYSLYFITAGMLSYICVTVFVSLLGWTG